MNSGALMIQELMTNKERTVEISVGDGSNRRVIISGYLDSVPGILSSASYVEPFQTAMEGMLGRVSNKAGVSQDLINAGMQQLAGRQFSSMAVSNSSYSASSTIQLSLSIKVYTLTKDDNILDMCKAAHELTLPPGRNSFEDASYMPQPPMGYKPATGDNSINLKMGSWFYAQKAFLATSVDTALSNIYVKSSESDFVQYSRPLYGTITIQLRSRKIFFHEDVSEWFNGWRGM